MVRLLTRVLWLFQQGGGVVAVSAPRRNLLWRFLYRATAPLRSGWAGYQENLAQRPVPTKAATSFCGFILGDLLAQNIEGEKVHDARFRRYFGGE
jgi:hypothetical protein